MPPPGKTNAATRDPSKDVQPAADQAQQAPDRLADLKSRVVTPWSELLAQIPPATDPTKIALVRQTTYQNLFEKKAGYDAFAAYLSADPALAEYAKAAKDAEAVVNPDRGPFAEICDATMQLTVQSLTPPEGKSEMLLQRAHAQCLAAYVKMSPIGRAYLATQKFVNAIQQAEVKQLLLGKSKLVPLDAATSAPGKADDDKTLEPQIEALKKRILAEDPAAPLGGDTKKRRKELSNDIGKADLRVLDKLRADVQVSLKLAAIASAEKGDETRDYMDLSLQVDSAQQLWWSCLEKNDDQRFALIKGYLEARPGDANLALRSRILQNTSLADAIKSFSAERQQEIARLVARGTATKGPIDILHDAAANKVGPDEALRAAIKVAGQANFQDLKSDQLFRHAIESGANRTPAAADGLHTSAYDFVLRGWGVIPGAPGKDPESALAKDAVNPGKEQPLDAGEMKWLNGLFPHTINKLGEEFSKWWLTDSVIVGALTEFENTCADPANRELFRRAHMNPGVELTTRANADSRIGNIRDKLHKRVGDEARMVAERILGIRVDAATVGRIDGQVTLAEDSQGARAGGVVPLAQAMREVKVKGDATITQIARTRAQTIATKLNEWHLWGGCAKKDVTEPFVDFQGKFGCQAETGPGKPGEAPVSRTVMQELEELTGMKGRIHPIELIVNEFHELVGGGDLAQRIRDRVHDGDQDACLKELGLDTATVAARNKQPEPPPPSAIAQEVDGLYAKIVASQKMLSGTPDQYVCRAVGDAWEKAKKLDAPQAAPTAQPAPAQPGAAQPETFTGTYRAKYGIDPQRHVVEAARAMADCDSDRTVENFNFRLGQLAEWFKVPVSDLNAAVKAPAPIPDQAPLPSGFTLQQAKEAAQKIWTGLHQGDVVFVRHELDGRRPDEQELIKKCFKQLSGDIELEFYVRQALEGAKYGANFKAAGGGGVGERVALGGKESLGGTSDARSWTETLDITQKGSVGILTRVKVALDNSNLNEIFAIVDDATVEQRRQILGDEPTMGLIRDKLGKGVDFDRVYGVLTGTADMATRLYSRSEGNVDSSFWRHFSDTDTEGMKRDIKDYAARRKEFHTRALEDAGQDPKRTVGFDEAVAARVKDDLLKAYDNPDARKVIENEFPAWFTTQPNKVTGDGRDIEGMMLNGGEESNLGKMTSDGFEWSSDILAQVRKFTVEQRQKYRNDPEFLRKVTEHCTNIKNRRLILLTLQSDEPAGEDHIVQLLDAKGGMSSGKTEREMIARLTQREITRIRNEPDLVSDICDSLNQEEQTRFRALLGFDVTAAIAQTGAKAVAPSGPQIVPPDGKVPQQYELAKDSVGRIDQAELERLGYLKIQSQQKLHLGAKTSWWSLLGAAVDTFKAEFKPKFQPLPASVDAPQPGQADQSAAKQQTSAQKLDKEATDHEKRLRGEVWADVAGDVLAATDNDKDKKAKDSETVKKAVFKEPGGDPSDERLKSSFGTLTMFNDDDDIEKTIREASEEQILTKWSSIVKPKFDGDAGKSFAAVYKDYSENKPTPDAKTPPAPEQVEKQRQFAIAFQRYVIEPSIDFERLVLPHAGSVFKDHEETKRVDQQLDRKNPQFAKYRTALNDRIKMLDPGKVSATLGIAAGSEDAKLVESRLRGALTSFHVATEDYAKQRGDGQSVFGQDEGRRLDRAFGDYRKELNEAQDGSQKGDISDREKRKLDKLDDDFHARTADYVAAKEAAAQIAATIVATVVSVCLTALTAGAATPLAMMLYGAAIAGAAATGEVVTKQVVLGGRNYDAGNEGAKQIAAATITGFIAGGAQYYAGQITNGLAATKTAGAQGKALGQIAVKTPTTFQRVLQTGGRTLVQSTLSGVAEVAGAPLDPAIWVHGWDEGWYRALDKGIEELKAKPGQILRQTITAMIGDAIAGKSDTTGEQVKPGERIGMDRVLKQAASDMPVNVASAAADVAIGVGTGEIKDVRSATGSIAQQTAGGIQQTGMGLHDGSVHRSQAENFALGELTKYPDLFKSETEKKLYLQAVESSMHHGEPPTAQQFAAARDSVARTVAASNPKFGSLSHEEKGKFLDWVRAAPTPEESTIRAGRDPHEVLGTMPKDAAPPANPDVAAAKQRVTDANGAVTKIGELHTDATAHEKPNSQGEAKSALDAAVAAQAAAKEQIKIAADAEAAIRKKITELPPNSPEATELAKQAELAASAKRRCETLADLLDASRLQMTAYAQEKGFLPKGLPAHTEPPAAPAVDFSKVQPGQIPEHVNPEQKARFEEAKKLYDQLKGDRYQGEDIAKLRWQTYLREHGVDVPAPKVDEAHTATKDSPGEIREVKKEVKAAAHADATVAGDPLVGQRMSNTGKVGEPTVRAALDEIAKGAQGIKVVAHDAGSDSITVELADGKQHKIKVIDAAPTNGNMAGLKTGSTEHETIVFVSDSITDEQVPRALGGIIYEAIARAGKPGAANDNAASFGQLDAMFAHLHKVSEQKPAAAPAAGDAESINLAAKDAASRENPRRITAEIDLMLFKLGIAQPGEQRDAMLAKMPKELAELVKAHLAGHAALGFKPDAALDESKVARPKATEATTLAPSKVLPGAPAEPHAYTAADYPKVLELQVHLETIKEIDDRLKQRDQRNASGKDLATGESLRRREHVEAVKRLMGELQLGGSDKAYYEARLKELEAMFPGVSQSIAPEVTKRVDARIGAEQAHREAEAYRKLYAEAQKQIEQAFIAGDPFITDRVVVGGGMTALADVAVLGNKPQAEGKPIDPKSLLMVGGPDLIARLDPTGNWGQRAEVFDPKKGMGTAHPMFAGENQGTLQRSVEDQGEFIHVGELNDAMDLARKKLGAVAMPGKVEHVEVFQEGKTYDPPWHDKAKGKEVRLAIRCSDGTVRYAYAHNTDITTGLGATAMPNEGLLSEKDRKELIKDGVVFGGERLMQDKNVEGKRVLVVAFGPTGAWAAVEAVKQKAARVDWAGGSGAAAGSRGDNASALAGVQALDRTQDAFKPSSQIHTTLDRIVSIEKSGEGGLVTFAYGSGADERTYKVQYDRIAMTAGFDTSGTRPQAPSDEPTPDTMLGKGKDGIAMQAQKGTKAPVLQSKDGHVLVMGPAAWDGVNASPEEQAEIAERRKKLALSADSPDARTMEAGGQIAELAHPKKEPPIVADAPNTDGSGPKDDAGTGIHAKADKVPGSSFTGKSSEGDRRPPVQLAQVHDAAARAIGVLGGETYKVVGDKVTVSWNGETVTVTLAVSPKETTAVATHTFEPKDGQPLPKEAVVTLSQRAREVDLARAVAHELAEIRALMEDPKRGARASLEQSSNAKHPDKLSHHDFGRRAEIELLLNDFQKETDPAKKEDIKKELAALVRHMNLDPHTLVNNQNAQALLDGNLIAGIQQVLGTQINTGIITAHLADKSPKGVARAVRYMIDAITEQLKSTEGKKDDILGRTQRLKEARDALKNVLDVTPDKQLTELVRVGRQFDIIGLQSLETMGVAGHAHDSFIHGVMLEVAAEVQKQASTPTADPKSVGAIIEPARVAYARARDGTGPNPFEFRGQMLMVQKKDGYIFPASEPSYTDFAYTSDKERNAGGDPSRKYTFESMTTQQLADVGRELAAGKQVEAERLCIFLAAMVAEAHRNLGAEVTNRLVLAGDPSARVFGEMPMTDDRTIRDPRDRSLDAQRKGSQLASGEATDRETQLVKDAFKAATGKDLEAFIAEKGGPTDEVRKAIKDALVKRMLGTF